MKELRKGDSGFSLIELVIVIALTGLIAAAITTTIFQVFNMNTRTANRMTAVSQVQNAGKIVSEDMLETQPSKINVNPGGDTFLALGWTAQNGTVYAVNYTWGRMPSGDFKILWRNHYVDTVPDSTTKVAEYIAHNYTSCAWNATSKTLTFRVTATVGGESETRVYEVKPRPGS